MPLPTKMYTKRVSTVWLTDKIDRTKLILVVKFGLVEIENQPNLFQLVFNRNQLNQINQ